jgi:hypothetical protein
MSQSGPPRTGPRPEQDDEELLHRDNVDSEDYEIDDQSEDEPEIDKSEQELEGESKEYWQEELKEQEPQEDSSGGEEEDNDLEDSGEVEEGIEEEDKIEEVEEPESIFNWIAGLITWGLASYVSTSMHYGKLWNLSKKNPPESWWQELQRNCSCNVGFVKEKCFCGCFIRSIKKYWIYIQHAQSIFREIKPQRLR